MYPAQGPAQNQVLAWNPQGGRAEDNAYINVCPGKKQSQSPLDRWNEEECRC